MRPFALTCVALLGLAFLPEEARPILIETGPGKRVGGHVVSENATHLEIRIKLPGGKEKVEQFDKSKITIVHRVNWQKVEKLNKSEPKGYRDLAEELAEKAADPEAQELAVRLYLIAAYLDPENLGRSSLLAMAALAANPEEARVFRAMAYLVDPKHDPSLLKTPKAPFNKANPKALENFLLALRNYRSGMLDSAKKYALMDGVAPCFEQVPGLMPHAEFITSCQDGKCKLCAASGNVKCRNCSGTGKVRDPFNQIVFCADCKGVGRLVCTDCSGTRINLKFTDEHVRLFARAQLWAINQTLGADDTSRTPEASKKWTDLAVGTRTGPVRTLVLESLTSFDPRKCVYRNGAWVEP